jgi:hypothetical protein
MLDGNDAEGQKPETVIFRTKGAFFAAISLPKKVPSSYHKPCYYEEYILPEINIVQE